MIAALALLAALGTTPAPGSDTPKMTYMLAPGGGKVIEKNIALELASGFGYAITGGAGDSRR